MDSATKVIHEYRPISQLEQAKVNKHLRGVKTVHRFGLLFPLTITGFSIFVCLFAIDKGKPIFGIFTAIIGLMFALYAFNKAFKTTFIAETQASLISGILRRFDLDIRDGPTLNAYFIDDILIEYPVTSTSQYTRYLNKNISLVAVIFKRINPVIMKPWNRSGDTEIEAIVLEIAAEIPRPRWKLDNLENT